jgi:hypothetical protein
MKDILIIMDEFQKQFIKNLKKINNVLDLFSILII